jgi:hypothetical protein
MTNDEVTRASLALLDVVEQEATRERDPPIPAHITRLRVEVLGALRAAIKACPEGDPFAELVAFAGALIGKAAQIAHDGRPPCPGCVSGVIDEFVRNFLRMSGLAPFGVLAEVLAEDLAEVLGEPESGTRH